MSRRWTGIPSTMWGIGSELAPSTETSAVSWLTSRAKRTTTVPRSKGPTLAEVDGDPVDDVGDRVGVGTVDRDFGGFVVDVEGEADHHGAEVEGADLGGGGRGSRRRCGGSGRSWHRRPRLRRFRG